MYLAGRLANTKARQFVAFVENCLATKSGPDAFAVRAVPSQPCESHGHQMMHAAFYRDRAREFLLGIQEQRGMLDEQLRILEQ